MQFRGFELRVLREPESGPPYCDVFHGGERVARVLRRADCAENVILSADAPKCFSLTDLNTVTEFAEHYIDRDIPLVYLEEYAARRRSRSADYFLGLYNTSIAAATLYILSLNKHVFDPGTEIGTAFIDMEYLFERLITLLDEGALHRLPPDVFAELCDEIDKVGFPLAPEHRAVLARVRASQRLSELFPHPDDGSTPVSA
jgi:hypothetical protein